MMIESTIQEWIKDFEGLEKFDHAYGIGIFHNGDVISALHSFFDDINKYGETIQLVQVFEILFKYYKLNEPELKRFTLQYLPQLLDIYLNANARTDKELSAILDAFLLGLYNLEIADDNGQPKVLSFRLPSLAQSSIYHEPVSLAPASLTESALKRLEQMDSQLVRCGPLKPIEVLIAQNRLPVLTELLFVYNKHIAFFSKISIEKMCNISFKIVTQGFPKSSLVFTNHEVPSDLPRLKVSSPFLCQLLYSLYFAVFNGFKYEAVEAIEAIAMRAEYNRFNDIILLTNAIRNYLKETQTDTGPMGIGVSITSTITTTTNTTLSKSMITNASFRTKKLPDDIPIQDPHQQENADGLGAISEEKEESGNTPEIHPRRSLPRMAASFGKKTKEKIAIAVKSGSVSSIKSITKSNSILLNGGDASETDESGIELGGSDISNLALQENENTVTPYNNRKNPQINNTLDIDVSRSMQVSSV